MKLNQILVAIFVATLLTSCGPYGYGGYYGQQPPCGQQGYGYNRAPSPRIVAQRRVVGRGGYIPSGYHQQQGGYRGPMMNSGYGGGFGGGYPPQHSQQSPGYYNGQFWHMNDGGPVRMP